MTETAHESKNRRLLFLSLGAIFLLFLQNIFSQHALAYTQIWRQPSDAALALVAGYVLSTVALFAVYASFLFRLHRSPALAGRRILVFPAILAISCTTIPPAFSIDLYSYVGHGVLEVAEPGAAYRSPVAAIQSWKEGEELKNLGWRPVHGPTPYGPAWTAIEKVSASIFSNVKAAAISLKVVVILTHFANALLIWLILSKSHPAWSLTGTAAYLWNPMLLFEFAREAHNDALMAFCLLLSIAFVIYKRPSLAGAALTLGVLVKVMPLLFFPLWLAYVVRTEKSPRAIFKTIFISGLLSLALTMALVVPFGGGPEIFKSILSAAKPTYIASVSGLLVYASVSLGLSPDWISGVLSLATVAFIVWRACLVRDSQGLVESFAYVSLFYLLVATPAYWPWYSCLPVVLALVVARTDLVLWSVTLSLGSRLTAPLDNLRLMSWVNWNHQVWATTLVALLVPTLIYFASRRKTLAVPATTPV